MKRGLALVLAAVLLPACGSDDGDDSSETGTRAETTPSGSKTSRFESPRIAFTFDYPAYLDAEKDPGGDVLARVTVRRGQRRAAVQVRRTARTELAPRRYLDEFKRDLEGEVRAVTTREERVGDLDTGVLTAGDSDFTSSSYFFTGAGQTWQVECIADPKHRQAIDDACRVVLESVDFHR